MTTITIPELTEIKLDGNGVFDSLMRAVRLHLDAEYTADRIRGPEYAQVYLGSVQAVLAASLQFILQKQEADKKAELLTHQIINAGLEGDVLRATKCKLDAEYDLLLTTNLKTQQELALLAQKTTTEKAQTMALGVDEDSIVGRQKALYLAQTEGFKRDAEQKAANIMVSSWNARRMTDEATVADGTNLLNDVTIGRAITKLLDGVNA